MGVGGQRHASAALPSGKRHDSHCIGGWVDPRAGMDLRDGTDMFSAHVVFEI